MRNVWWKAISIWCWRALNHNQDFSIFLPWITLNRILKFRFLNTAFTKSSGILFKSIRRLKGVATKSQERNSIIWWNVATCSRPQSKLESEIWQARRIAIDARCCQPSRRRAPFLFTDAFALLIGFLKRTNQDKIIYGEIWERTNSNRWHWRLSEYDKKQLREEEEDDFEVPMNELWGREQAATYTRRAVDGEAEAPAGHSVRRRIHWAQPTTNLPMIRY